MNNEQYLTEQLQGSRERIIQLEGQLLDLRAALETVAEDFPYTEDGELVIPTKRGDYRYFCVYDEGYETEPRWKLSRCRWCGFPWSPEDYSWEIESSENEGLSLRVFASKEEANSAMEKLK